MPRVTVLRTRAPAGVDDRPLPRVRRGVHRTLAPLLLLLLFAARFAAAQALPYGGDLGAHVQAGPERDVTRPIPQSAPYIWSGFALPRRGGSPS